VGQLPRRLTNVSHRPADLETESTADATNTQADDRPDKAPKNPEILLCEENRS